MILKSERKLTDMKHVLFDSSHQGNETAYWVFSEITNQKWYNMTVIAPRTGRKEFTKTFGHYHQNSNHLETYKLVSGRGIFLLQKKFYDRDGKWIPEKAEKVYFVQAYPGDVIMVPKEYGHSWSNISDEPMVTFDDWKYEHSPNDYLFIKKLKGMAYYLVEEKGSIKAVKNTNYSNTPKPVWVSSAEFNSLSDLEKQI